MAGVRRGGRSRRRGGRLRRTACEGAVADRVRELLADRTLAGGEAWSDVKLLLKAKKRAA
jgi:hypothetical protein